MSSLMNRLFERYQLEGIAMPYTWEDFRRDCAREDLHLLSPRERLEGISAEERLEGISLEDIQRYVASRKRQRGQH